MSLKRAIRKVLKDLGIETEKIGAAVEEVTEIVEEEFEAKVKVKSEEKNTEASKQKEQTPHADIEAMKKAHAEELAKIKLEAKVEAELEKLNIQKGYEDIVKGMINFDQVKLDDKGVLTGLKEQTDTLAKEKVLLFNKVDDKDPKDKKIPEGFEKINNQLPEGKPEEPDLSTDFITAFTEDLPQTDK